MTAPLGEAVPNVALLDALDAHPEAHLVAVVHAETSTGVEHPLRELGEALAGYDALLMADCVTSLGGVPLDAGAWQIDYAYSLHAEVPRRAARHGAGRDLPARVGADRAARRTPVPLLARSARAARVLGRPPVTYHHTAPILVRLRAARGAAVVLEEGLEPRWARHAAAAAELRAALYARGL